MNWTIALLAAAVAVPMGLVLFVPGAEGGRTKEREARRNKTSDQDQNFTLRAVQPHNGVETPSMLELKTSDGHKAAEEKATVEKAAEEQAPAEAEVAADTAADQVVASGEEQCVGVKSEGHNAETQWTSGPGNEGYYCEGATAFVDKFTLDESLFGTVKTWWRAEADAAKGWGSCLHWCQLMAKKSDALWWSSPKCCQWSSTSKEKSPIGKECFLGHAGRSTSTRRSPKMYIKNLVSDIEKPKWVSEITSSEAACIFPDIKKAE